MEVLEEIFKDGNLVGWEKPGALARERIPGVSSGMIRRIIQPAPSVGGVSHTAHLTGGFATSLRAKPSALGQMHWHCRFSCILI